MIAQQVICLVLQQCNSILKFSDFVVYCNNRTKLPNILIKTLNNIMFYQYKVLLSISKTRKQIIILCFWSKYRIMEFTISGKMSMLTAVSTVTHRLLPHLVYDWIR